MITVFTPVTCLQKSHIGLYLAYFLLLRLRKWSIRLNLTITSHILTSRWCLSSDNHSRCCCTFCLFYLLLAAVTLSSSSSSAIFLLPYLKWHLSPCAFAISVICICLCVLCTSWGGGYVLPSKSCSAQI